MKNKRTIKGYALLTSIILVYLVIIFSSFLLYRNNISTFNNYDEYEGKANKIILFIGDGMGENHIKVTEQYYDKKMSFSTLESGYVTTFSQAIFSPTDSAAAATALATGTKVKNGEVSTHNQNAIETITEYAKTMNLGTGIVTTDALNGATPAAFSAHATSRKDTDTIIKSQINSKVDIFLGAGLQTYTNYFNDFKDKEYEICTDLSQLDTFHNSNKKILGTFDHISNKADHDETNPTLQYLTQFAITYLDRNFPNGYFLMVEGAHIDKKSHSNNITSMMEYLDNFSDSVKIGLDHFSDANNYCIIITADHETGGLKEVKNQDINNNLYRTTGHTSANVRYFIKSSNNIDLDTRIDNTDIYKLTKTLLTHNDKD